MAFPVSEISKIPRDIFEINPAFFKYVIAQFVLLL